MAVLIAFGSNVGCRLGHFQAGKAALRERLGVVRAVSPIFATEPCGCEPGAGEFFNAMVEVESQRDAREILEICQLIEQERGRAADHGRYESRTLDLDLIHVDGVRLSEVDLILPHPRVRERMFVLAPLVSLRPDLVLPGEATPVRGWLEILLGSESLPRVVYEEW